MNTTVANFGGERWGRHTGDAHRIGRNLAPYIYKHVVFEDDCQDPYEVVGFGMMVTRSPTNA